MEKQGNKWVVLVPGSFQGHITPMLQLGTVLHSKGFSITVAHTKFNAPDPSDHPDFVFLPIHDNLSDRDSLTPNLFALVSLINENCRAPFKECVVQMMEKRNPEDEISCIISDVAMYFPPDVAKELGIPSIVFRTSNASCALAYTFVPRLHAEGLLPLQDSKLEDLVPELHPLRFKDLPISSFAAIEDILKMLNAIRSRRSASAIIWNTIDELEHSSLARLRQHYQVPILPIGPLHKIASTSSTSLLKEERSCISWLDKQAPNSVIYVSLGSIVSVDEKVLAEMAWGLANSNQPFLWVIRPGSVRGSEWIELLPEDIRERTGERGFIVKWAPQKEVLAHKAVGGFWSHCGWNSSLESICEGVPMICWPCFGDQKVNARYLTCVWRIGLELEHELGRGEIERAVRKVLVGEEGDEIRQRAIEFKQKAEVAMRKGGSSFNSLNALVEHIRSFKNGSAKLTEAPLSAFWVCVNSRQLKDQDCS